MKRNKEKEKINPKVKEVLNLLGMGSFLIASLVFPGLPIAAKLLMNRNQDFQKKKNKEWEKFNLWRLKAILKRLQKEKIVEIKEDQGIPVVVLTEKGKTKYLKYQLEKILLKNLPNGIIVGV